MGFAGHVVRGVWREMRPEPESEMKCRRDGGERACGSMMCKGKLKAGRVSVTVRPGERYSA